MRVAGLALAVSLCTPVALANLPPGTPYVIEPATDQQVVNPFDVHMETTKFIDLDEGDVHRCSDWEIWTEAAPRTRLWSASCLTGTTRTHTHLGDGVFEGPLAGQLALPYGGVFRLRVRHSDSSGDPATEWSDWGERRFRTEEAPPPGVPGLTWLALEPGYVVEDVAGGLRLPVDIAFVPGPGSGVKDPLFYVSELYGTIKVVTRDGTVTDFATGLLNFDPSGHFPGSGEQGLTGLALDPVSGDLFAAMLYSEDPADETAPHHPKIVRFRRSKGGLTEDSRTTIFDPGVVQGPSHQISRLTIAPDGTLLVHMGDSEDALASQDPASYQGKILRLNLDGTPAAGNPFATGASTPAARDFVYAMGFRNPFGGAWRATEGAYYELENGPNVDRLARIVAGRNYLWDDTDASMRNFAVYNWTPSVAPVGLAFVQAATFSGSGFPLEKRGHAFAAESGPTWATGPQSHGKRLTEIALTDDGRLDGVPTTFLRYVGDGKATVAGLAAGPDGLYFTDLYEDRGFFHPTDRGAKVHRIRFAGAAEFTADVTGSGTAWFDVRFTDRSNLPSVSTWAWNFGDGGTSAERDPSHTFTAGGVYDVTLTVTGPSGTRTETKRGFVGVGRVGLSGVYLADEPGARPFTRVDPGVDFDWSAGPPAAALGPGPFSATWTGELLPRYSEAYTLSVTCPGTSRLVVGGATLLASTREAAAARTARVSLTAERRVPLVLSCGGIHVGQSARLAWSSASQHAEAIPAERLLPGPSDETPPSPPSAVAASTTDCGVVALSWEASADEGGSGLAGYRVYAKGALLAELPADARSYVDAGVAGRRARLYHVSAFDHAGNESARATATPRGELPECGEAADPRSGLPR